ncbi:MAG: hypothetical protein HN584_07525 [Akkermansiaceae bacterium]|jgi:tetratricopeptide (TPR) repeat protein|nr:hypothetical protein [Akkermansiaceae bacterium]MDG1854558.1 hypothetical protein [Verrucomicrobiales bacterium]
MNKKLFRIHLFPVLFFVTLGSHALSHHDTKALIEQLTKRINSGESTAENYYRRAIEYRVLGQLKEAKNDLRIALQRNENFILARREITRILSKQGQHKLAILSAEKVITTATTQREKSSAMILLARMLLNAGEPLEAIKYSSTAFKLNPNGKLEWYLLHARLLGELKRDNERPEILRKGYQLTGSIVLRNAWIDSLLECKKYETALPIIEKELISSRLKSSWKLRRAKAYIGIGKINDAMDDLRMCLKELDQRIHPKKPDMTLIADRGMVNALLGNIEAAKNDLSHLIHIGAEKWVTIHLNKAISLMENQ